MYSLNRVFGITLGKNALSLKKMNNIRIISTSNKKDDTSTVLTPPSAECEAPATDSKTQPKKLKYFQDYGFFGKTEKEETVTMHFMFFTYITLGISVLSFLYLYRPQTNLADWARREAYLELRRREKLGLPPIDRNYVDPSTIYLPSDEELGDTEIII